MCKVYSVRHPDLQIQKYKKKGNNEDIDTKENKPEEVKCNVHQLTPGQMS